jgi:hypothetical protein
MVAGVRQADARKRSGAFAASVAAHAVLFGLLVWHLGRTPERAEPPTMNVRLVAPPRARPPDAKTPSRSVAHQRAPAPEVIPARPALLEVPPTVAPRLAEPAPPGGAQPALRALVGCQHADLLQLSSKERDRCQDRFAAAPAVAPPSVNLDKDGRFAAGQNDEPYLSRRPTKGCKVRTVGDQAPSGEQGGAAGVQCVFKF